MDLDDAIQTLRGELADVRGMAGCSTCECFVGVAVQAAADLKAIDSPVAAAARAEFLGYRDEAAERVRSCRHCEVCVPTGPYRRFREALAAAGAADV